MRWLPVPAKSVLSAPFLRSGKSQLKYGAVIWLLLLSLTGTVRSAEPAIKGVELIPIFQRNPRVLFQGDSITDGNRGRSEDPNHILGHGYAFIIAAKYGAAFPGRRLVFMNRGVSGNKVSDLKSRWQKDTLDLKPDVLSVLIGVNDNSAKVPFDEFERGYDELLTSTVAANANVKLVLCEPFTLRVGDKKEPWEKWAADIKQRQEIVARLATKHHAALVHFQKAFDDASNRAPNEYWIWDSVHPTYSGHQIMADEWVRAVREHWPEK